MKPTDRERSSGNAGASSPNELHLRGGEVGVVNQPAVTDFAGIIDAVRSRGSVHYLKRSVPGDFAEWRRHVRQVARAGNVSISVTRSRDYVIVENRDWEPTEDEDLATADVIDGVFTGKPLSLNDALHARRRQRIRLVPPDGGEDHPPMPPSRGWSTLHN